MRSVWQVAAALTIVVALFGAVRRVDGLREGLTATYYRTTDWTDGAAFVTVDKQPSTAAMVTSWGGDLPPVFSAVWTGSLLILRGGTYAIEVTSDDGAWVYLDGHLIVDVGGTHSAIAKSGSIDVERGVHRILIRYVQGGGNFDLKVSWARNGDPPAPIPSWVLAPGTVTLRRFLFAAAVRWAEPGAQWLWVTTLVLGLLGLLFPWLIRAYTVICNDPDWRRFAGVAGLSLAMNAVGLWSGIPERIDFFGDEIVPSAVFDAIAQKFSNGWWAWYPPVHYYVLAVAYTPFLLLHWLGRIDVWSRFWYDLLSVITRLISLVEGLGILTAIYLCGVEVFSKRAALFGAAATALIVPFVMYTKAGNIEIPYVFWCAVSLLFFLRVLRTGRLRDMLLFAATGTLAICTKDQAYALYVGTPFVLFYTFWRARRDARERDAFGRTLMDHRLIAAAVVVVAVFAVANNLLFNYRGYAEHVRFITGDARMVRGFDLFDALPMRRLQVLTWTATLDLRCLGWPLLLASVGGWVSALRSSSSRAIAVALTVMVASYYLTFINVVMYCYDRFLLPVCLIQALFAGVWFDRWLARTAPPRRWREAAVAGVFVYAVLYVGMIDAQLLSNSRYDVEGWLRAQAQPAERIGTVFPRRHLPRLDGFDTQTIETEADLKGFSPAYFVFNADYARAVLPTSSTGEFLNALRSGTLGYTLALAYRTPAPWGWLPGAHPDLAGPRLEPSSSTLRDINPMFLVYRRMP